ncbi:hypothetical protein NDU88_005563 [Pleurodeles waltl]|uniref:Uncharacterized protein n=1 Tax=Pleurodeles waltl TaxID=8319 RepID=A0AAV7NSM6_PLEWA|nr:hypothetical protein NDU88_005563 [Pleurodeles waltl]
MVEPYLKDPQKKEDFRLQTSVQCLDVTLATCGRRRKCLRLNVLRRSDRRHLRPLPCWCLHLLALDLLLGLMDGRSCVEDVDLVCEIDHAVIVEGRWRCELEDDSTLQRVIGLIEGV